MAGADVLVVPGLEDGRGLRAYLVEADAEGVTIERQVRGDAGIGDPSRAQFALQDVHEGDGMGHVEKYHRLILPGI